MKCWLTLFTSRRCDPVKARREFETLPAMRTDCGFEGLCRHPICPANNLGIIHSEQMLHDETRLSSGRVTDKGKYSLHAATGKIPSTVTRSPTTPVLKY